MEAGDRVEHVDGAVISKPAGMAGQAKPSVVEPVAAVPSSGIKTSDVTVVLATYDLQRWPFLAAAVESLLAGPDRPRRIIVCADQNDELCERVRVTWPQVMPVLNTRGRGASVTRNTGAEFANTPYIAFLDDDIQVYEGWLSRLLEPFADPVVVGTGGGVVAGWERGRPNWFPEEFDWVVGASYRGMPTVQSAVRNVWSENMAVRTDTFNAVGGFRPDFGKVGHRNRPEDTDLCIRMAASVPGARWIYAPDAVVEHHVPVDRASFSFYLRRSYNEGRGKLEMAYLLGHQEKLEDEQNYLRMTLPSGIWAGLWAAARHGDMSGLLRAAAIVAGILAAALGAVSVMWKFAGKRWRLRGPARVVQRH
jgi:glycosyltransferase involved in cell wall biosynthesis